MAKSSWNKIIVSWVVSVVVVVVVVVVFAFLCCNAFRVMTMLSPTKPKLTLFRPLHFRGSQLLCKIFSVKKFHYFFSFKISWASVRKRMNHDGSNRKRGSNGCWCIPVACNPRSSLSYFNQICFCSSPRVLVSYQVTSCYSSSFLVELSLNACCWFSSLLSLQVRKQSLFFFPLTLWIHFLAQACV